MSFRTHNLKEKRDKALVTNYVKKEPSLFRKTQQMN